MIKYELDQIKDRIRKPKKSDIIKAARDYSIKINMHVTGKGLDSHLEQIKNYENTDQLKLRQKYARSNKSLYTTLLRPLDKVFTSKGFAKYYNLQESFEKKFIEILSDVRDNQGLQKWLSSNWKNRKITDPNGIIYIEISRDGMSCYPTYKSIFSIRDFDNQGNLLNLIIFEPERVKQGNDEIEKVRVIDSEYDYVFKRNGDSIELIEEETFPNYFKRVAGRIIGSDFDENYGYALSFIDPSIEIAEEILQDNSVKIVFKRTHGYQIYWEIARKCVVCKGIGLIDGKKCPSCGGDGLRHGKDVSDKIIVTENAEGNVDIPPAGYVSADVSTWTAMNNEEDIMTRIIHKVQWGTLALIENSISKTATEIISNNQPVYDALYEFSKEAENIEKFLTDLMGQFYFGINYRGSTIVYGKRYQIESPDQLLKRISEAKLGNIPEQAIRNIYIEYLQTQYGADSFEMSKQIRMFTLDYYPIWTVSELNNLGIDKNEIYKKLFYWEWIRTLSNNDILFIPEETLKLNRDIFVQEKLNNIKLNNTENAEIQGNMRTIA